MFEEEIRKFREIERQKAKQVEEEKKQRREQAIVKAEADFPRFVEDLKRLLSIGKKSFELYVGFMPRDHSSYLERLQKLFDNRGAKVRVSSVRWVHMDDDMSGNYARIEYYGK